MGERIGAGDGGADGLGVVDAVALADVGGDRHAAAVVVALATVIVNFCQNKSFTTIGTISDGSGGSRLWDSGIRLDK